MRHIMFGSAAAAARTGHQVRLVGYTRPAAVLLGVLPRFLLEGVLAVVHHDVLLSFLLFRLSPPILEPDLDPARTEAQFIG